MANNTRRGTIFERLKFLDESRNAPQRANLHEVRSDTKPIGSVNSWRRGRVCVIDRDDGRMRWMNEGNR